MGANQSSQISQLNDILNQNVTNIVNKSRLMAEAKMSNVNSLDVEFGPNAVINCDNIDFSQKITSSQNLVLASKIQNEQELKTLLKSAIDNTTEQNNQSVNSFLATSFNNQSSNTDIKNIMKNIIETNITNENVNVCNAVIDNANQKRIVINGKVTCTSMNNAQSIVNEQLVNCITDQLVKAAMQNEQIADAVNKSSQTNTSENKGIGEAIASIFEGLGKLWVLAIVLVVGFLIYSGKMTVSTLTNPKTWMVIGGLVIVFLIYTKTQESFQITEQLEQQEKRFEEF